MSQEISFPPLLHVAHKFSTRTFLKKTIKNTPVKKFKKKKQILILRKDNLHLFLAVFIILIVFLIVLIIAVRYTLRAIVSCLFGQYHLVLDFILESIPLLSFFLGFYLRRSARCTKPISRRYSLNK